MTDSHERCSAGGVEGLLYSLEKGLLTNADKQEIARLLRAFTAQQPVAPRAPRRDPIVAAIASLAAAISLLERTPKAKKAAASDKMFDQMLDDYRRALANARDAISEVRS